MLKSIKSSAALWLLALILSALLANSAIAQEDEEKNSEDEEPKTIAELTEDAERIDGLFTLFRDNKTGATSLLITKDQLDKEFIYWLQVANGVVDAGFFKGAYGPSRIIEIRRRFDKIEIVQKNTAFYFDPENAISRAAQANISESILAVQKIAAEDEESGDLLIDADKIFASEALAQMTPTPNPDADPKTAFNLGKLDDDKTHIINLRSYPENTDVEVEYVFSNPTPTVGGNPAVTNARNVSIRVMHSFIEVPENDFQSRRDDARIGFFGGQVTDLTSMQAAPYRDHINRWNLVKKEPGAAMSEPVEPITWWIENTTPVKWRELIRNSALEWNKSFAKAGFSNAVVVKIQPDDAQWDAGDIRYNVLRWTSSPNPPFGGYGPSFTNPRTGEIIGADVMLEYSFLSRLPRVRGNIQDPDALTTDIAAINPLFGDQFCTLGHGLQTNTMFVRAAADALYGMDDTLDQQLAHDTMHYLILHELGHTLGMNHNMKATQLISPDEAWDSDVVNERGLAGSVMDYPAVNFAPTREQQTLFYTVTPGPYDDWFINYGYSEALSDPVAEEQRLTTILARSTEPQLAFGNDADDMRSPGTGIDPRVNIYDMSTDAIVYASRQMKIMKNTLDKLATKPPATGDSYQETVEAIGVMLSLWRRSAAVTSRYVGGVYIDRAVVGQQGAGDPLTPVAEARQRQAMGVLSEQVFAPEAFLMDPRLLRQAAPQRRGFSHFGATEDPKLHDAVLNIHKSILDHLLNPVVLKRITDSGMYGNEYSLGEMMNDLTDAVFEADARGDVNTFRQNLQVEYVQRLSNMARKNSDGEGFHSPAVSLAVYNLGRIQDMINSKSRASVDTLAHRENLELLIGRALSNDI